MPKNERGTSSSVYLTVETRDRWLASGVPLGELVRRGLDAGPPLEAVAQKAAMEAAAAVRDDVEAVVADAVKRALREAQGGSW